MQTNKIRNYKTETGMNICIIEIIVLHNMHCRVSLNIRFLYSLESLFSHRKPDPRFLPLGPPSWSPAQLLYLQVRSQGPEGSSESHSQGHLASVGRIGRGPRLGPLSSSIYFSRSRTHLPPHSPKNWLPFHFISLLCSDY